MNDSELSVVEVEIQRVGSKRVGSGPYIAGFKWVPLRLKTIQVPVGMVCVRIPVGELIATVCGTVTHRDALPTGEYSRVISY